MTDYERISKVLEYLNISANKLSECLGLPTAQVFYDIKKGRHGISKKLADAINGKYLNINTSWLLTGQGEMLKETKGEGEMLKTTNDELRESQGEPCECPITKIADAVSKIADSVSLVAKGNLELVQQHTKLIEQHTEIFKLVMRIMGNDK